MDGGGGCTCITHAKCGGARGAAHQHVSEKPAHPCPSHRLYCSKYKPSHRLYYSKHKPSLGWVGGGGGHPGVGGHITVLARLELAGGGAPAVNEADK